MDAISYMNEIVKPTIRDFESNPTSRRHAFLTCVAVFHFIDYLDLLESSQNLRGQFRRQNANFAIVDRVAHAFKHVQSGNALAMDNQPLAVRSVFERPPAMAGVMQCGLSRCGDEVGGVEIWGENGPDLLHVVKRAAEFLRSKLQTDEDHNIGALDGS